MAPLLYDVFSTPRYETLEDPFKFGLNKDLDLKDREVKKKIRKQKIIPLWYVSKCYGNHAFSLFFIVF